MQSSAASSEHPFTLEDVHTEALAGFRGPLLLNALVLREEAGSFRSPAAHRVDLLSLARDGSSGIELLRFHIQNGGPGCYGAGVAPIRPSSVVHLAQCSCFAVADGTNEICLLSDTDLSLQMKLKLNHAVAVLSFDEGQPASIHGKLWAASSDGRLTCLQQRRQLRQKIGGGKEEFREWTITATNRLNHVADGGAGVGELHSVLIGQSSALLPAALFPAPASISHDYAFTPSKGLKNAVSGVISDLLNLTSTSNDATYRPRAVKFEDTLSRVIALSVKQQEEQRGSGTAGGSLLGFNCPTDPSSLFADASGEEVGATEGVGMVTPAGSLRAALASAVTDLRSTNAGQAVEAYLSPVVSSSWGTWIKAAAAAATTVAVSAANTIAEKAAERAAVKAVASSAAAASAPQQPQPQQQQQAAFMGTIGIPPPLFSGTAGAGGNGNDNASTTPSNDAGAGGSLTATPAPPITTTTTTSAPFADLSAPLSVAKRDRDYVFRDPGKVIRAIRPSPDGHLLLATDASGRVLLFDATDLLILRVWKGHRDAQVAWLALPTTSSYPSSTAVFAIFSPRRGLVEVWQCEGEHPLARRKFSKTATTAEGAQLVQVREALSASSDRGDEDEKSDFTASSKVLLVLPRGKERAASTIAASRPSKTAESVADGNSGGTSGSSKGESSAAEDTDTDVESLPGGTPLPGPTPPTGTAADKNKAKERQEKTEAEAEEDYGFADLVLLELRPALPALTASGAASGSGSGSESGRAAR